MEQRTSCPDKMDGTRRQGETKGQSVPLYGIVTRRQCETMVNYSRRSIVLLGLLLRGEVLHQGARKVEWNAPVWKLRLDFLRFIRLSRLLLGESSYWDCLRSVWFRGLFLMEEKGCDQTKKRFFLPYWCLQSLVGTTPRLKLSCTVLCPFAF